MEGEILYPNLKNHNGMKTNILKNQSNALGRVKKIHACARQWQLILFYPNILQPIKFRSKQCYLTQSTTWQHEIKHFKIHQI